jgi:hypothetical protein
MQFDPSKMSCVDNLANHDVKCKCEHCEELNKISTVLAEKLKEAIDQDIIEDFKRMAVVEQIQADIKKLSGWGTTAT